MSPLCQFRTAITTQAAAHPVRSLPTDAARDCVSDQDVLKWSGHDPIPPAVVSLLEALPQDPESWNVS